MKSLELTFGTWLIGIGAAMTALVVGLLAFPRLRALAARAGFYLAIPAALGLLVLAAVLQRSRPPSTWAGATRLPDEFVGGYWVWLALLTIAAVGSTAALLLALRRPGAASDAASEERFPDLEHAFREIALRLEDAGITPEDQTYYLVLAPDEEEVRALVETAGLQVFATAPDGPSPLRAHATSDGVLLSCVGASAFGQGDPAAASRLGSVCRMLRDLRPDAPPVRGITVLIPMPWVDRPEATADATHAREDLRAARRATGLRCPVFVLFTAMEHLPGFTEFIGRMAATGSPQVLGQRVGFALPRDEVFGGELARKAMVWMSGWFHDWILNLIAADPLNAAGNERLIRLDYEFLRRRKGFCAVLESALVAHRGSEPPLIRGCYFVATGPGRDERAFAAGLLRGARGRIIADHVATSWSETARWDDRRHGRTAIAVCSVAGVISLLLWAAVIARTPWGWLGLIALAVAWLVVLLRLPRR